MTVTLKCGFRFAEGDIGRVMCASVSDVEWSEGPTELQHGSDHKTEMIVRPIRISGVDMPSEGIVFIRVVTDSRTPRTGWGVQSYADAVHPGKTQFLLEDFRSLPSGGTFESAKLTVLEEVKRFFRVNMPD